MPSHPHQRATPTIASTQGKPVAKFARLFALAVVVAASPTVLSAQSETDGGDIDCKVILCLAGGFPSGCGDALSYMLDRISPPNPQPPFGFCPMSNGEAYTNFDAPYSRLNRMTRSGWDCPAGKNLFFARHDEDEGHDRIEAFCYTDTRTVRSGWGEDRETRIEYLGRSSATPVNLRIQITVEPHTAQEFASPTYVMNYHTGYYRATAPGSAPVTLSQSE